MLDINSIVNEIPIFIYWLNLENIYQGCSKHQATFFGLKSNAEIVGKNNASLPIFLNYPEMALKIDENNLLTLNKLCPQTFEENFIINNKKVVFLSEKFPLFDDNNNITGIFNVAIEKTKYKEEEQKKINKNKQIENTLNHIVANMPGHVFWKNKNGVYLGCNNLQAKNLGMNYGCEIIGKTDYELPWKKNIADNYRKNDLRIMKTGKTEIIEEKSQMNGQTVTVLSQKAPLINEKNEIYGILGIAIDITHRKQAEDALAEAKKQAETANEIKSNFIACMSHDLRTPLNGIFGAVQVLEKNPFYPQQKVFIESINKSTHNLLYLVEDILNFTKLEAGKVPLHSESFDMRKLVEDIVSLVTSQANKKNIKLIVSYCNSVPCFMISDPNAIRRILINLLGNAIKFTNAGHVLVSIDLVKEGTNHATIQITVEDTGIGIPKDKIDIIFDRFLRLHNSYSSHYQGTGLGLTIARKLSESLGGTINVNSQLNCGSTFWCTLPVQLQSNAIVNSKWLQKYANINVLIVDDYPVRADNIKKQLASPASMICQSDILIQTLNNAYQANNPFQVVMIDDEILYKNAIYLAELIKEMPEFKNTMLVLLSGPKTLPENDAAKNAGFFKQFIKPVQPEELTNELTSSWEVWSEYIDGQSSNDNQKKLNILLVEDDIIAQTISKEMLQQLSCKVDVASSGKIAIENAVNKNYDLIFMDIGLPDKDGLTVTREIIRLCKKNTPHIFGLTAHAFEHNRKECINAGMASFITKPVSFEDFEKILSVVD